MNNSPDAERDRIIAELRARVAYLEARLSARAPPTQPFLPASTHTPAPMPHPHAFPPASEYFPAPAQSFPPPFI